MDMPKLPRLPQRGMVTGYRDTLDVFVDGFVLDIYQSQQLRHHSEDFCWGYHGSGPSQLALALLLEFKATKKEALAWYQSFKVDVIATLPDGDFEIPMSKVTEWLEVRRLFEKEFPEKEG